MLCVSIASAFSKLPRFKFLSITEYLRSSSLLSYADVPLTETCSFVFFVFFQHFPPRKWALTLFCSGQQRAPTHQTEECRHRSCTQWRETLGKALNFLDTHILQLSSHRSSEQLWEKKERTVEEAANDRLVAVWLSLVATKHTTLNTCSSEYNQEKYELHHTELPRHQWVCSSLILGVCFFLIIHFQGHSNMCSISPEQFNVQWTAGERRVVSRVLPYKTSLHLCQKSVSYKSGRVGIPHFVSLCP